MRIRLGYAVAILLSALVATAPAEAQKKTLVIGLNQDPDILDPTLARTYVGRIVFEHMCEKLYEIDENLKIFPQLAAELPAFSDAGKTVTIKLRAGVKFNDGTPMTAEAVKFSLDRHREMKGSSRRSELDHVDAVDVVDPTTVRLRLKAPFSPITAILADRAGMPVSPTQARKLDDKFGTAPVCVGPWAFAERVAQDRIVLEKSTHYFDPGQAKFDRLVFRIITDDNVRLANLRSGDIDFMHLREPDPRGEPEEGGQVRRLERGGHRLLGDQPQPPEQEREAPGGPRGPRHPARERPPRARGLRAVDRPRGPEPGGLGGPVHARLHGHLPGQPLLRQEPQVLRAGRGAREEAPGRRRAGRRLQLRDGARTSRPNGGSARCIQGMAKEAGFNITLRPAEFASALNDDDAGKRPPSWWAGAAAWTRTRHPPVPYLPGAA